MDNTGAAAARVVAEVDRWLAAPGEPEPWVVETSGSTGRPKRVVLPRRAMLASAEASARRVGGSGPWVLAVAPTYVAGLNVVVRSLLAGHRPVVVEQGAGRSAGEAFEEAAAAAGSGAYVSVVPTQLHRLLETSAPALAGFSAVLLGGGPIDPTLRTRAEEAGVRVVATYGSAETSGGCVYDGLPLDGVGLAIGTDGRVRLSGPVLFDGYRGDPTLTAEVLVDGWFLTSDAGRLDEDGRLHVLGRIDDVVVTGGVNVPAPAVAARLRAHPSVAAAEALGVPDEEWGHRLVAFVVPAAGAQVALEDLRDWVAAERPRSWAPRQLVVLPEVPMLPNGKPDRLRLRELA